MTRLFKWIVRRVGPQNLLALALLAAVMVSVVVGLGDVIRGLDTRQMLLVVVVGVLVGWGLAATPLPGWGATILGSVSGLGLLFLRVGRLGGQLLALLRASVELGWGIFRWLQGGLPVDLAPVILSAAELWGDVGTLLARVRDWALALAAGELVFDPVAVAFTWGLALWGASVWAGWIVRRRNWPLPAIVPAGALLTATLAYAGGGTSALLMFLGATLLLLALVGYDVAVRRWEAAGIDFADPGPELAVTAVLLSLVLVTVAGLSPSISMQKIAEFVRELGDGRAGTGVETLAESLGVEQRPAEPRPAGGLPRRHVIRSGPGLSQRVVMFVSTGDLPPGPPQTVRRRPPPPRYYWRGASYDIYVGYGWLTAETGSSVAYEAGEPAVTEILDAQRTVRQEVQVVGDLGNLLHAAGALVVADQDYKIAWRSPGDAFAATIEAATYRADSVVPVISEEGLRAAGTDYPDWVRERYLTLPDLIPERVLSLAHDLTATEPTPYDRARAIETHLRTISYTLDVPAPPYERDVVDYFLFDLQKGYCDYYATAMVVLAREAGVPARYVTGYATGAYDAANARYVVVEADAHAWVEVYFPGYGWVEFEPTAGLPAIVRPAESPSLEWPEPEEALEPAVTGWEELGWPRLLGRLGWSWWLALPGGLALLVLASVAWTVADGWWLRRLQPALAVTTLYGWLRRHGQRLAAPTRAGDTPYEFVASLAEHVAALARENRWGEVLVPVAQEVRWLADLYVQASYSPRALDAADHARLVQIWQRLRWRLWLARLLRDSRGH
ncbi:MAG: hypothetical protein B6I34_08515 [Anaerolineaceae bacterium 4572_32.1]|nr:MAG: hypothetical protein B6I34_08515 [Anaerolineaceae bacterium 4572_32.1]